MWTWKKSCEEFKFVSRGSLNLMNNNNGNNDNDVKRLLGIWKSERGKNAMPRNNPISMHEKQNIPRKINVQPRFDVIKNMLPHNSRVSYILLSRA